MTLFEYLFMAHLLGDWLLQTEWQAENKRTRWRALFTHIVVYHAVVLAVLLWQAGPARPLLFAVVLFLAVTHTLLDHFTVVPLMRALRITVKREPERWLMVAVDQSVHLLLIGVAVWVLTRGA
jgi:hypothetical protein